MMYSGQAFFVQRPDQPIDNGGVVSLAGDQSMDEA